MGYLLQNVVTLSERLAEAEKASRKLEQRLNHPEVNQVFPR
jgi:hypothetical protein